MSSKRGGSKSSDTDAPVEESKSVKSTQKSKEVVVEETVSTGAVQKHHQQNPNVEDNNITKTGLSKSAVKTRIRVSHC